MDTNTTIDINNLSDIFMTAKMLDINKYITGFYYELIPPKTPIIQMFLNKKNLKNNCLEHRHFILQQKNIDWNLISIISYQIDYTTLRKATDLEIKSYLEMIKHYN